MHNKDKYNKQLLHQKMSLLDVSPGSVCSSSYATASKCYSAPEHKNKLVFLQIVKWRDGVVTEQTNNTTKYFCFKNSILKKLYKYLLTSE